MPSQAATKKKEEEKRAAAQRRRKAAKKKPDLTKLYRRKFPPMHFSTQEFRIYALRPDVSKKYGRKKDISGVVESLEWRYEEGNPTLLGTVTMRRDMLGGDHILHDGHVLRLVVLWGGTWKEVWRMRMYDGKETLAGELTWELADDGRILQESKDKFHFTKSKKKGKPKGWKAHEIVREVARMYRIPLGKIAEGKHFITDISGEMSPMEVIQKAYAIEKNANGRRFVIVWKDGKLNVVPMRRNPLLYELKDYIEDAVVAKAERSEKFATAVTVRASIKGTKGSRKRSKLEVRWVNEKAVAQEGFIHLPIDGKDVKDRADAIRKAKMYMKEHSERKKTLESVQHKGIAFLRRGDGILVSLPKRFGFKRRDSFCFIKSGSWSLSGGDFNMNLDLTFDDPYELPKEKRKEKDKKTRDDKRKAKVA